jgi:hypothetical protein
VHCRGGGLCSAGGGAAHSYFSTAEASRRRLLIKKAPFSNARNYFRTLADTLAVSPLESLIPLEEEDKPSNIPDGICWFK